MERPGADSEEKREPVGDIDIAVVGSLKVLDPRRPIREADMCSAVGHVDFGAISGHVTLSNCNPRSIGRMGPKSGTQQKSHGKTSNYIFISS